ncbi:hypothetical protein NUW54_g9404 [Trametes sanguinea]|uniref:Uncharacterized protein n=1 Tax=Trametes sanguinea TaxID=158606 RepID=A0ACC1P6E4_9APHY|nr:hypothetical protein NUW54_g9404 [Trametes sanguinea]
MLGDDEDVFDSVTWESPSAPATYEGTSTRPSGPGFRQSTSESEDGRDPLEPKWEGYLITSVKDPVKELPETKDAYVSYLVTAKVRPPSPPFPGWSGLQLPVQTNLPIFSTPNPSARRRFQDFVFLRTHLAKDFPACVVPPLPDKHRLAYIGSYNACLATRLSRGALCYVLSSSRQNGMSLCISMFAHPPVPEQSSGVIDSISDSLLNAFSRVRKPDERFLAMRESVDKFEEGVALSERVFNRVRNRTNVSEAERDGAPEPGEDLTGDYHDLAVAVQGLGFLESGITDPLNHFSNTLLEFSALLRHTTQVTTDPFLVHLHSLLQYSHANRAVLKLRDQKQMDFEELSEYLSAVTAERDRLAAVISGRAGSTGLGLGR